jgi:hypothetical protein
MHRLARRRPSSLTFALFALLAAVLGTAGGVAVLHASAPPAAAQAQSAAYSTFKDSFQLTTAANQFKEVARLTVPPGRYVVVAKLFTGPPQSGLNEAVRCDLVAGADFDRTVVNHDATTAFTSLALNVVHRFTASGTIRLNCANVFTAGNTSLGFVKITASRVDILSNIPSP